MISDVAIFLRKYKVYLLGIVGVYIVLVISLGIVYLYSKSNTDTTQVFAVVKTEQSRNTPVECVDLSGDLNTIYDKLSDVSLKLTDNLDVLQN